MDGLQPHALSEFNYQMGMNINALVTAMGMMSANLQRIHNGEAIAYDESAFDEVLVNNGVHCNALIESGRRINQ